MGLRPGYEGRRTVEEVSVANPLATLGLDAEGSVSTARTVARVNVTESPIEHMFHRGEIDERLRKAADIFRSWVEHSTSIKGQINYESVVVDCSKSLRGFPERAVYAVRQLDRARKYLGEMDFDLLVQACAIGNSIAQIAQRWYPGADTLSMTVEARRHVGRRVKDALVLLANLVGLGDHRFKVRRRRLVHVMCVAHVR